jgi:ribose transport system ATP-binding protein
VSGKVLQISGLSKAYAAPVLRAAFLELARGEVHALVGENGAGKSTLCRIVAGLVPADAGEMTLDGRPFRPRSRPEAEARGVRMVVQELSLVPALSVAENLLIQELPSRLGFIRREELRTEARRRLERVGLCDLDADRPVSSLGVGQRQLVEIAAALARPCDVLILDEPTAALSEAQAERLFGELERVTSAGAGVLYVSHRLDEVRRVAHRISVLRDGQVVRSDAAREVTSSDLVRLMVGRDPELSRTPTRRPSGAPALTVAGLRAEPMVHDVSFTVHDGEILGLAGLMGSGRTETLRAIFGADPRQAGAIILGAAAAPARIASPREAVRAGIALVTEDRKEQGLLLPLSVRTNLTLGRLSALAGTLGFVRPRQESAAVDAQVEALAIHCASVEQPVAELSGGNQQKVVLGRGLAGHARVLLLDEPTRGVDAGARLDIHRLLRRRAAEGRALVVVSSELEELLALCDRIAVMSAGRLVATFDRERFDRDQILQAALIGYAARGLPA